MKMSGWVWLVVGLCLSVIILCYGYFQYYEPNKTETALINENAEKFKPLASKDTEKKAKARVTNAQLQVDTAARKWQDVVALKTPMKDVNNGGIDLKVNPYQLTLDAPKFRNSVQRAVNRQLRHGGIKVISGAAILAPPTEPFHIVDGYFNYPAYPFPVCFFDFGTITVTGTYNQIMENVRGWSSMPNYLAVTHDVALIGTSPNLTGTYSHSVVALIRGQQIAPDISGAAGGDSAGVGAAGAPPRNSGGGRGGKGGA